jgi:hypothetical protein
MEQPIDTNNKPASPAHPGRVGLGVILLVMGLVMLLDRTETLGGYAWRAFPGFILIGLGIAGMLGNWRSCANRDGSPFSGVWLMLVGVWLVVNSLQLFGLTYQTSWPLLIVAAGTVIVLRELFPAERRNRRSERS